MIFISRVKLKAVVGSMHQFCGPVRSLLPERTEDRVVETVTLFLYLKLAQEVFGRRFTGAMWRRLRRQLKFTSAEDVRSRIDRIATRARRLNRVANGRADDRSPQEAFSDHVAAVVKSILAEAKGTGDEVPHDARESFANFEKVVRRMKDHLLGIRRQPRFLMQT
jgi:hypothetical protein